MLFFVSTAYVGYILATLPDIQALKSKNPSVTALMEQRADEKNTTARPIRTWVSYNNISPHLRNAVLIAEDSGFFQHTGYDLEQIKESARRNWREGGFSRGASTITQQLAKNLYLSTSKNPLRKIREFFIAQEIERNLSKFRIFEIYLNVIEWGDGIYGVGPAAQAYFGKSASQLLPEEAAILAAMIPNPRRYTPARNLKYLEKRKAEILSRLSRWNYLDKDEYEAARVRPVVFRQVSKVH
ncbi:MAG: monofunctional biosynthetic peptidoglycan transglycosylase [Acidobacteria bacterium 13_1_40CM_4_58_4]|nr:MAG: monofunctional biosynthetic peptidoglycan transglycosylase [Acidobacteria bacterium 13_1_40CM_4_58_4]